MSSQLDSALQGVDWNSNVGSFCSRVDVGNRFHESNLRLAVWSRQLELIDKGNTAIPFVREMQHAGHNVACAAATGLYKPAAAAMRSLVECALYYSYFRTHPSELATLVRDDKYYVSKKEILQYFAKHVPDYSFRQGLLSLN